MNIFYARSNHQNQKESDGGMWSFCVVLFFTLSAKAGMEIGWELVSRAPLLLSSSHRLTATTAAFQVLWFWELLCQGQGLGPQDQQGTSQTPTEVRGLVTWVTSHVCKKSGQGLLLFLCSCVLCLRRSRLILTLLLEVVLWPPCKYHGTRTRPCPRKHTGMLWN